MFANFVQIQDTTLLGSEMCLTSMENAPVHYSEQHEWTWSCLIDVLLSVNGMGEFDWIPVCGVGME